MRFSSLLVCAAIVVTCMPAYAVRYQVRRGESLQSYIDRAVPSDVIELEAGATFTGNFILRRKAATTTSPGGGSIYITTSQALSLPARVTPADAPKMAKIVTSAYLPAFATEAAASGYVLRGLEITVAPNVYTWSLVALGTGNETDVSQLPRNITLSQCYIHGDPVAGTKNGVLMNLVNGWVTGSYISDIKSTFQDSHAINGFNGIGPFRIDNNYLEAAGENIMFGGGRAMIPGLVPSNITVRNNVFRKPTRWKVGAPDYQGTRWIIKNHLELKNAQNVTIDNNLFEDSWAQGQSGASILLTVSTEGGTNPWAVVQDVTITNNLFRRIGIGILTHSQERLGGVGRRWTIRNNVFEDVNAAYGANLGGTLLVLSGVTEGVVFDRNTGFASRYSVYMGEQPSRSMVFSNNIFTGNFCGDSLGCNATAIGYTGQSLDRNVFIATEGGVPYNNVWAASVNAVGFTNPAASNYILRTDSPYYTYGVNGTTPGAKLDPLRLPRY